MIGLIDLCLILSIGIVLLSCGVLILRSPDNLKRIRIDWLKKVGKDRWEKMTENDVEVAEEENFDEFIDRIEKRMDRIPLARKAETHESRAQVALMFENAYTQKKITEASVGMKNATWLLATATVIFAYVAIIDSANTVTIITVLKNVFFLIVAVFLGWVMLLMAFDGLKFLFKFVMKKLMKK